MIKLNLKEKATKIKNFNEVESIANEYSKSRSQMISFVSLVPMKFKILILLILFYSIYGAISSSITLFRFIHNFLELNNDRLLFLLPTILVFIFGILSFKKLVNKKN